MNVRVVFITNTLLGHVMAFTSCDAGGRKHQTLTSVLIMGENFKNVES